MKHAAGEHAKPTLLSTQTAFTIDLIRADIDDSLDVLGHATRFQQNVGAICVVHGEGKTVAKGVINMGLQQAAKVRNEVS